MKLYEEHVEWGQIHTVKEWEDVHLNKENLLPSHDWVFLWLFAEAAMDDLSLQQHHVHMTYVSGSSLIRTQLMYLYATLGWCVWTAAGSRIYYCFKYLKKVLNWTFGLFMQIPICLFGAATFSFYPCSDTPTSTCCTANKWALLQPVYYHHLLPFTAWR